MNTHTTSLDEYEPTDADLAAQVSELHRAGHNDWHVIADQLDLASTAHAQALYQLHHRDAAKESPAEPTLF